MVQKSGGIVEIFGQHHFSLRWTRAASGFIAGSAPCHCMWEFLIKRHATHSPQTTMAKHRIVFQMVRRRSRRARAYVKLLDDDLVDTVSVEDSTLGSTSSCSNLSVQLQQLPAAEELGTGSGHDASDRVLKLFNFVGEAEWDIGLLQLRMTEHHCNRILFVDTIPARNLRRWQFLKTRLCRQLMPIMEKLHWKDINFQSTLSMSCSSESAQVSNVISLLEEAQKDPEIVALEFKGIMKDLKTVVYALVGLLSLRDRTWQGVTFSLTKEDDDDDDDDDQKPDAADLEECHRILQQASAIFKLPISF
jgi:hypothetical protein